MQGRWCGLHRACGSPCGLGSPVGVPAVGGRRWGCALRGLRRIHRVRVGAVGADGGLSLCFGVRAAVAPALPFLCSVHARAASWCMHGLCPQPCPRASRPIFRPPEEPRQPLPCPPARQAEAPGALESLPHRRCVAATRLTWLLLLSFVAWTTMHFNPSRRSRLRTASWLCARSRRSCGLTGS